MRSQRYDESKVTSTLAAATAAAGVDFSGPVQAPAAPRHAPRVESTAPPPAKPAAPASGAVVELGADECGGGMTVDIAKVVEGRLLIQGISGAGKSWTLRRLLEESARRIQQLVVDPEGEFRSLAELLGYVHVDGSALDTAAIAALARRAREHRSSVVLDLSQLRRQFQMIACTAFLNALLECAESFWTPALVAVDEAQIFAPFGGTDAPPAVRQASVAALGDLMSLGRKRGLAGVLATRRLARLSKGAASEVQNFLVGVNTLDIDIKRAAETVGWSVRKASDRLPLLAPGEFVGVGPAFSRSPAVVKVGPVRSRHLGATPAIDAPARLDPDQARMLLGIEQLVKESSADAERRAQDEALPPGSRAVRAFIRDPAFSIAGRAFAALTRLAPAGATMPNLAAHLEVSLEETAAAVALLEGYRAVELVDAPAGTAVRVPREMLGSAA